MVNSLLRLLAQEFVSGTDCSIAKNNKIILSKPYVLLTIIPQVYCIHKESPLTKEKIPKDINFLLFARTLRSGIRNIQISNKHFNTVTMKMQNTVTLLQFRNCLVFIYLKAILQSNQLEMILNCSYAITTLIPK